MRNLPQKLCLLALLLIGCSLSVSAQNKTITGTVRDAMDVVIGASVTVKGDNSIGTITDMDGRFTLSVPASAKELKISFIGYEDQMQSIGNKTHFDITLKESSVMLDEVVAIGYAKVKRKDLTGSSVSVSANDLRMSPVTTAAQALQGKAAGVSVVQQSGAPGAEINITVRGGTSITQGTTPLYIVDGFQMDNGLQNVDINDIESIDVMKDASATAIYGARGSNGVILITTNL
jgi:TonB-dependent SusC/RagA subfamily outer membrane receptor